MQSLPKSGQDGPYAAPIKIADARVLPEWIDFNGHMNAMYYGMQFQTHAENFLETIVGFGHSFAEAEGAGPFLLQVQILYLGELKEGEAFHINARLLDHDTKRMHMFFEMVSEDKRLCATAEYINMNVNLTARRGQEFPDWLIARLVEMKAAHATLDRPKQAGASMGLRG